MASVSVENPFCKIFLEADKSSEEMAQVVAAILDVNEVNGRQIVTPELSISVCKNSYRHDGKFSMTYDGFIYASLYLEVEPTQFPAQQNYVDSVGELLASLWSMQIPAIAACEFEHELPRHGGLEAASETWTGPIVDG